MTFPSSEEISAFTIHLRLTEIQRLVTRARSRLAELIAVGGVPLALTIDLPTSPSGHHNRVVLGRGRGYVPHWLIVGSRGHDFVSAVWDVETTDDQLRDALLATYDACVAKSEIDSPWRWAEPFRSTVVLMADGLTKRGLEVEGVVSSNRLMPDRIEGAAKPHWVPAAFGDAVRIKMSWGVSTLARKQTLGWVLDANDHLVTRRIDLARYLTGTTSPAPGLATDDADILVQAVARAVVEGEWGPGEGRISQSDISNAARPLDAAAAWWLRELGYTRVETGSVSGSLEGVTGSLHVVTTEKRCRLRDVKKAFADAVLEEKPLVMFAEGGYTRNATAWANEASVAMYGIDAQARVWAASALAAEHIPQVI
jgi:hypothetical protein